MNASIDNLTTVEYTQGVLAFPVVAENDIDAPEDTTQDPLLDRWLGNLPDQAEEAMEHYFYE